MIGPCSDDGFLTRRYRREVGIEPKYIFRSFPRSTTSTMDWLEMESEQRDDRDAYGMYTCTPCMLKIGVIIVSSGDVV